ncbi:cullin-4A [Gonapodya prolifera JEL478]|uniref:Cullin-4A n=1 Tax=Gonapodya prolifera (strain JEL478) TaxID=1344416 RepID=A0A139AMB2_GONPJ|nr:cullin-4A [Gonapodya prolifera JEL478]|eukprot:KXS17899.1 cullin-4A [Gonapodya prolifera JEL478]
MDKGKAVDRGSNGFAPAKKPTLVIKGFKNKPKLPDDFEQTSWQKLEKAVRAIQSSQRVQDSLEELYRTVENLCLHKYSETTYTRLSQEMERQIKSVKAKLESFPPSASLAFLAEVRDAWTEHCRQMLLIRSLFLYLDRTYALQTNGIHPIWELSVDMFRTFVLTPGGATLVGSMKGLLLQITSERNGNVVSRDLLRSIVQALLDLDLYDLIFEPELLAETDRFYTEEGDRLTSEVTQAPDGGVALSHLLKRVEQRVQEESNRCTPNVGYLTPSSRRKLTQLAEAQFVKRNARALLDAGFDKLMDAKATDDLTRLYTVFNRIQCQDLLRDKFTNYTKTKGSAIVTDTTRDATLVDDLLEFKLRIDTTVSGPFRNDESFVHAAKESFERFINIRPNKPAELVAKYIDNLMRQGKGLTDQEQEGLLDRCLSLFRFIQGKDVFEAFYKRDLAKRLLLNRSSSDDAEKSMLMKLRQECGSQFTSKLEAMFKDIELSKDLATAFKATTTAQTLDVDLSVSVLAQGVWPSYPKMEVAVPEALARCTKVFADFYVGKHKGRKLDWQPALAHCTLKASFPKATKELNVSFFQTLVLLLFNENKSLSFREIQQATRLEAKELTRVMQSLALGKVRVLNKSPKSKDVSDDHLFEVNETFQHELFRVKINAIQQKETPEEQKATNTRVFEDRKHVVDAVIVRIMKSRKTLSHTELTREVFGQLKFPLDAKELKKVIEGLIDREFLRRDDKDASMFVYVA